MGIESLTAEQMFSLSKRIIRWYDAPKSMSDIRSLKGETEGVYVEVENSQFTQGIVQTDRYSILTRFNDTSLGEHKFIIQQSGSREQDFEGNEMVKEAFNRAWGKYQENKEKFRKEDHDYAIATINS